MTLIIGAGEVGTALQEVLGCSIRDLDRPARDQGHETIHVAFPWSEKFERQVSAYAMLYRADTVVVHSTVPVGTCDRHGWVHSPVRGRHPDLVESLQTFTKFFGGGGQKGIRAAIEWRTKVGPAVAAPQARTTELAKLWELVQFGVAIALEKALWSECETEGEYQVAYQMFGESYNEGYEKMGLGHFVRPVLEHVPGPIGGHCVRESMAMIDHWFARIVEDAGTADA